MEDSKSGGKQNSPKMLHAESPMLEAKFLATAVAWNSHADSARSWLGKIRPLPKNSCTDRGCKSTGKANLFWSIALSIEKGVFSISATVESHHGGISISLG